MVIIRSDRSENLERRDRPKRARQLGGDEAKVALVCLVKDYPKFKGLTLLKEQLKVYEDNVTVFGKDDLRCLEIGLKGWFNKH